MRILQLFNRFPWPLKDGGALGYYNWLKGYADANCQVTAAVLNTSKHFIDFKKLPEEVKNLAIFNLVNIDNRIKPLPAFLNLFTNKSYHVERFISKKFEELLIDLCNKNTYDVIVFESIFVAPYLKTIKKHSNAICILRAHNVEHQIWQTQASIEKNTLKKWYLNLLANRLKKFEVNLLNQFDGILPITHEDVKEFRKLGINTPMQIAAAGLNLSNFMQFEPNQNLHFFHLGSMDWMPNQEAILWFIEKVWPKVVAKYPKLEFTVAGRNMPDYFYKLNAPNVKIIGEVENAAEFMHQQSVMVVPLFSGSGMRIKILEGMAMGKCIISTSLGAQGILVQPNKEILIANTEEEFLTNIFNLIENTNQIKQIGEAAKNIAFNVYDNKKVVAETLKFYNGLINKTDNVEHKI